MSKNIIAYVRPASDAEAFTRQCNKRREIILNQIDSVQTRSESLPSNHPAQKGLQRTLDRMEDALVIVGTVQL